MMGKEQVYILSIKDITNTSSLGGMLTKFPTGQYLIFKNKFVYRLIVDSEENIKTFEKILSTVEINN